MFQRFLIVLSALLFFAPVAHAAESFALYGTPKYKDGFAHFDYVNPDAPKGGAIKLAFTANFDSMNPYILKGIAAPGVSGYVYQTLMTQSYDEPQSFYGLIANSIQVAEGGKKIRFTLDPRAKWEDGTAVTAEDVVFSFRAVKEKGHPSYRVLYKPMSIAKLGPREVEFTIEGATEREQPLLAASLPVMPKAYFCDLDGKENKEGCVPFEKTTLKAPMGSGPYKVGSMDASKTIVFERVKNYWGENLPSQKGLNNFDKIQIDVYRDDVVSVEGIKSHQFDYYEEFIARNWATAYDNAPAVKSGQLIKTKVPHKIPRGMQGFIFNTRLAKFSDVRVREAIGLTLDFEWMNKTLFYDAYERNNSYFNHTDFEAKGLPDAAELKLLAPFKKDLPESVFTAEYKVPTSNGTGISRENLIKAQTLLTQAGWVMKDGKRVNKETGEVLTIEFLMTQRTFERVIGIMRHNLDKLGIASSFRYVDASQYQKRVDHRQFDMVSIWWNQGLFYPGSEQYTYWHSSQADTEGSQNLSGIKNPAVDMLLTRLRNAKDLNELIPVGRALDRVLLQEHYVIPHWNLSAWRILYWNQFGRPKITPAYNVAVDSWWFAPKAQVLDGGSALKPHALRGAPPSATQPDQAMVEEKVQDTKHSSPASRERTSVVSPNVGATQ